MIPCHVEPLHCSVEHQLGIGHALVQLIDDLSLLLPLLVNGHRYLLYLANMCPKPVDLLVEVKVVAYVNLHLV